MQAQPDPRLEQARRFIKDKRQNEARALLVEILKTNPNDVTSLYLYAHVARNWQEAEKVLKRVLELDPLNYQARAALNKLQNRSVEQQPTEMAEPVEMNTSSSAASLSTYNGAVLGEPALPATPASSGSGVFYVAAALLLLIIIAGAAFILLSGDETPETNNVVAEQQTQIVVIQQATRNAVDTQIAELPPTWTPSTTPTVRPTRTLAPTSTPFPTRTLFPTTAPTEPTIQAFTINVRAISRIYNDYTELTAQAAWAEDATTFDRLEAAYQAIIASLELSAYDQNEDLDAEWVDFLDELTVLIEQQIDVTASRRELLQANPDVSEDDLATQMAAALNQQEVVEVQFYTLIGNATATQVFENQLNALKTPSVTPIVLPTVATTGE